MLKNDYLVTKIGVDTAENEPRKEWCVVLEVEKEVEPCLTIALYDSWWFLQCNMEHFQKENYFPAWNTTTPFEKFLQEPIGILSIFIQGVLKMLLFFEA